MKSEFIIIWGRCNFLIFQLPRPLGRGFSVIRLWALALINNKLWAKAQFLQNPDPRPKGRGN